MSTTARRRLPPRPPSTASMAASPSMPPAAAGPIRSTITGPRRRRSTRATPSAAPASLNGIYGSFTFNAASGSWTYTLDNNRAATQALNQGDAVSRPGLPQRHLWQLHLQCRQRQLDLYARQ
ncbi:hypothetical protein GFL57_37275 [Rhizobium leguminosarum bv. viciae]|nr:hypothetical protein [Rhizobium leguminosarum bv. viciae]